jgi:hypothetical protein
MYNRKITLEAYVVPTDAPGRTEATWAMKEDGTLFKQNLILNLWDLERDETRKYSELGNVFYRAEFHDDMRLSERVLEIAEKFKGTHSRRTNGYHDDASFGILQKNKLIEYIEQIAQVAQEPSLTQ